MTKIIAISTNKGGCLKTSLTTNISAVLSLQNKKVLIIDTDNQGDVALTFGKNPDMFQNTIHDVLVSGLDINEAIVNVAENIDIVPSNDDMAFFEIDVLTNGTKYPQPFDLLKNALENQNDEYDYILIDTPPNLGLTVGNVLKVADEIVTPFHPETYSLRSLTKTVQAISNFQKGNPNLRLSAIIPTKVRNTNLHTANIVACEGFASSNNLRITETRIPESITFANAVGKHRLPLVLAAKTATEKKMAEVYKNLVKEMNL